MTRHTAVAVEDNANHEHLKFGPMRLPPTAMRVGSAAPLLAQGVVERSSVAVNLEQQFRQKFGLTCSEARVALLLADRRSNREIAEEIGVTEHTARRHTEKVLVKLGLHRRTEVQGALLSAVAPGGVRPSLSPKDWYLLPMY